MAKVFILIISITTLMIISSLPNVVIASGDHDQNLDGRVSTRSVCRGTIAECLAEGDEEFGLDSEASRRILAGNTPYLSYDALNANKVFCSKRGVSYYNCQTDAQRNLYRRGCSTLTQCRS